MGHGERRGIDHQLRGYMTRKQKCRFCCTAQGRRELDRVRYAKMVFISIYLSLYRAEDGVTQRSAPLSTIAAGFLRLPVT